MLGAIKHLFQPNRHVANSAQTIEPAPATQSLHWPASGAFRVPVVGEAHYRNAIARVAQNAPGKAAMTFCTARLVPEDLNPHDENAVAVYFGDAKVGYLARETAIDFRSKLARHDQRSLPQTTCDAAVVNGLVADGKAYDYSIELDLELDGDLPRLAIPTYLEVSRRDPAPPLRARGAGLFDVTVWLPHDALHDMDKRQRVEPWTTAHWDSVNYYLRNSRGIGLGHKVVAVPKNLHATWFEDREPEVTVVAVKGRWLTLLFKHG